MFDQRVLRSHHNRFPFNYEKRRSTDVCCMIIGAIFALTMFIIACCMWNKGTKPDLCIFRQLRKQLLLLRPRCQRKSVLKWFPTRFKRK